MGGIYQLVGSIRPEYLASAAAALFVLDVFIAQTTLLLLLGVASLLFAVLIVVLRDPVLLTWLVPVVLLVPFIAQRWILSLTSKQKLPHEERVTGDFDAVLLESHSGNLSKEYFYGYKDPSQSGYDPDPKGTTTYRALLDDGRSFPISVFGNHDIVPGKKCRVTVNKDGSATYKGGKSGLSE